MTTIFDKPPPQNIVAEQAVLGGMLLDNTTIDAVRRWLCADDFLRAAHRKTFEAICHLHDSRVPVDPVTL